MPTTRRLAIWLPVLLLLGAASTVQALQTDRDDPSFMTFPAWQVAIDNYTDPYPDPLLVPEVPVSGMRYLGMEVMIENGSDLDLQIAPWMFRLRDTEGRDFGGGSVWATTPTPLASRVVATGEQTRGWVWYEVPADAIIVEIVFIPPAPELRLTVENETEDAGTSSPTADEPSIDEDPFQIATPAAQIQPLQPEATPIEAASPEAAVANPEGIPGAAVAGEIREVVDGDTIVVTIDGTERVVDLLGLDAPELATDESEGDCFGSESAAELGRLIRPGRAVWLEGLESPIPTEDPLPAFVWLVRGGQAPEPELVNERLIRTGFATVDVEPAELHANRLMAASAEARQAGAGLWTACTELELAPEEEIPAEEPVAPEAPLEAELVVSCEQFGTFEEAQIYYQANPDAQPIIDPNADGRACEVYFGIDEVVP
jgi:endonuclease YncB( thermonuclease family)